MRRARTVHDCIPAIEFAARSDRCAVLKKHEWSGAGQDFDGKFARRFCIWNVHVSYGIHKAFLSAQGFDFNLRSQGAQRTAIPGGDAVCRHPSHSTRRTSVFASLSRFCEHLTSNQPGGEDLRRKYSIMRLPCPLESGSWTRQLVPQR
jgi:hypothetical protein